MNQEKWESLITLINEQYEVIEHKTEDILEGKGTSEFICFRGPMGKIKLEREVKPVVTGRKVLSSRRIGSEVSEEFEYSDSEMIDKLNAFRWNDSKDDWDEIDAAQISNMGN
jgi:hypothetical protein